MQVVVGHLERAVEAIARKHRLKRAAKEAERARMEEEERHRRLKEEAVRKMLERQEERRRRAEIERKHAEEERKRLLEEEARRAALAEEERRRSAEVERRRLAQEEKERRRIAEALASEYSMTHAGQLGHSQGAGTSRREGEGDRMQAHKMAGQAKLPPWWNEECKRAKERYAAVKKVFELNPSKSTSFDYDDARKALDEAERKAVREHEQSSNKNYLEKSWWNKRCEYAEQKLRLAQDQLKQDEGILSPVDRAKRKNEINRLHKFFKKEKKYARLQKEADEKGVSVETLVGEKGHIRKLFDQVEREAKKGAGNAARTATAKMELGTWVQRYETKYGTRVYFDSNGEMNEDPKGCATDWFGLPDPPGSKPREPAKTLDAVLSGEAEGAPWWGDACRKADESFRDARNAHREGGKFKCEEIRALWRTLLDERRKAMREYIEKNDVKGKEKERLLLFFQVNEEEAGKLLGCCRAGADKIPVKAAGGVGEDLRTILVQCVPKKSYDEWHKQWEEQKMKVREVEMHMSSKVRGRQEPSVDMLKSLEFERGLLEEVVRCAREAGYNLKPKWLPRDLFENFARLEAAMKLPENERGDLDLMSKFAYKVKRAQSKYLLENNLTGTPHEQVGNSIDSGVFFGPFCFLCHFWGSFSGHFWGIL